jgi:Xaa-Pro dipeptidase
MRRPDGITPALHFEREELATRVARARARLAEIGLDALLLFAPESQYYLTGFDTNGYVFFQCAVLSADGSPIVMLTRPPDVQTAWRTSTIDEVRVWADAVNADEGASLRRLLEEMGLRGARVGVELATYGLTAANYLRMAKALEGFCTLEDASDLVRALRLCKSPAEMAYVRRAASLADAALTAMRDTAGPGVFEGDVTAAGQSVIFAGGGDPAASGPVLGSGDRALLVRNSTGARTLGARDQLTIEFAGVFRRYHACLMQTFPVGEDSPAQRGMYDACRRALDAMTAAASPGRPLGDIDAEHRRVLDEAGFHDARMAACGYSLGATYRPNWMDVPPMLYAGNPLPAQPGMVLFMHVILADAPRNLAMSLGHTVRVGDADCEVLTHSDLAYHVCR